MRKYARKTGSKIKIQKKCGLPFFIFKYRKRKWFLLGIILFALIVYISTSFIWQIKITGNETIETKTLITELEEIGLKKGMLKSKVNTVETIYKLMIKRDDIAFMSINVKGTIAKVKIIEKTKKPELVKKEEPCDIISKKAGVIETINVLAGEKCVEIGSVVNEGDLLVKGIMEFVKEPEKTKYIHAIAEIKAKVWHEQSIRLNKNSKIEINKLQDFAYKIACDKIKLDIDENVEIIKEEVNTKETDEYIIVTVTIETIEDIGKEALIQN